MNLADIKKQAIEELEAERFRAAVDEYKQQLSTRRSFWERVFPWRIVIIRKGESK